jgi:hypothetical protein
MIDQEHQLLLTQHLARSLERARKQGSNVPPKDVLPFFLNEVTAMFDSALCQEAELHAHEVTEITRLDARKQFLFTPEEKRAQSGDKLLDELGRDWFLNTVYAGYQHNRIEATRLGAVTAAIGVLPILERVPPGERLEEEDITSLMQVVGHALMNPDDIPVDHWILDEFVPRNTADQFAARIAANATALPTTLSAGSMGLELHSQIEVVLEFVGMSKPRLTEFTTAPYRTDYRACAGIAEGKLMLGALDTLFRIDPQYYSFVRTKDDLPATIMKKLHQRIR